MSTRRIVTNLRGESEYVALPAPHWTGDRKAGTGIRIRALYVGPRTGRRFGEYYSVWTTGTGGIVGTTWTELDSPAYLAACLQADTAPVHLEPNQA